MNMSVAEIKSEVKRRMAGVINVDTLRDEVKLALSPKQYTSKDICITYMHSMGVFCVYNVPEMKPSIDGWIEKKCKCLAYNVKPITVNDKEYWMFVVQPPNLKDTNMCPLALAFNTMVSGYTYITHSKAFADCIVKKLSATK
jgi:hypothetical protein